MKKFFLFFIAFFIFLHADFKFVNVEGIGFGANKYEAVENALINAVGQVNGISINSARMIVHQSTKGKILINNSKNVVKVSTTSQARAVATKTKGSVYSYSIIYVRKTNGGFEAKVSATVVKYKSPGLNPRNRRSLAVLPFEYKKTYFLNGIAIDGKALSDRITQAVINKITQTRKFTVLDRQNSDYYNFEKNFLLSGNTDPIELSRLGKRLGADYFVIGQILDFGINKDTETNYYTGEQSVSNSGYATIAYRILNIPTQQIKWSDTINVDFDLPNVKRAEQIVSIAGDKIAQVLVDQIIFNIYPPRIIEVRGKSVVINMGGNTLHKGEKFNVYALGKKLYDPYTKEYLGRDEKLIGEIEITKVLPKISYAKVIKGNAVRGALIRKDVESKPEKEDTSNEGKDSMFDAIFHK
jgi:curli biogenesis system outer membrane secretion channel CsgG